MRCATAQVDSWGKCLNTTSRHMLDWCVCVWDFETLSLKPELRITNWELFSFLSRFHNKSFSIQIISNQLNLHLDLGYHNILAQWIDVMDLPNWVETVFEISWIFDFWPVVNGASQFHNASANRMPLNVWCLTSQTDSSCHRIVFHIIHLFSLLFALCQCVCLCAVQISIRKFLQFNAHTENIY